VWEIEQLSYDRIGQWYFVLGYFVVLVSHNWPLLLSLGLCLWWGPRLYRRPTQARVCWFFSGLLLGIAYEYDKHVAPTLHSSLDMVLFLEAGWLNRPAHLLIGPVARLLLFGGLSFFLTRALWLEYRAGPGRRSERGAPVAPASAGSALGEHNVSKGDELR
jgi:hypothetical protein